MAYVKSNVRPGSKSISASIRKEMDEIVEPQVKRIIRNVAEDAIFYSPVDTGAFITSWSVVPSGSGAGRSRTSRDKPRNQPYEQKASEALQQVEADIAALDVMNTNAVLRNRAPHAPAVEKRKQITTRLKDRYR